jgi:cysteinyl-tRNA synthetase
MALRYALLAGHPRKQLNFTLDQLHAAESALKRLYDFYERIRKQSGNAAPDRSDRKFDWGAFEPVWTAFCDDLNTPKAFGELFKTVNEIKIESLSIGEAAKLASALRQLMLSLLGFMRTVGGSIRISFSTESNFSVTASLSAPIEVQALAEKRWAAKAAKDFKAADALRAELAAAGWSMLDRKDGYSLEPLKK